MSFPCPHCGGEIVVSPGSSPFPGWRNPDANGANPVAQSVAQREIAQEILSSQDLKTSPKSKSYNQGYTRNFDEFWEVYPRHRDKRKAFKAWRNAVARLGATADARGAIIAGAIRYRDDPNRLDEFTKYAEGWLNGDGWEDEPLPSRLQRHLEPPAPKPLHDEDYQRALRNDD
jgi:hypothetical protein